MLQQRLASGSVAGLQLEAEREEIRAGRADASGELRRLLAAADFEDDRVGVGGVLPGQACREHLNDRATHRPDVTLDLPAPGLPSNLGRHKVRRACEGAAILLLARHVDELSAAVKVRQLHDAVFGHE